MTKKHTIKDIAELAGVSKGTVDRVIHKRGKVSEKALNSVNKILAEIDYRPNLIARNLKKNKIYNICVLLPDFKLDDYWLACNEGIDLIKREFASFNVNINTILYTPRDIDSFIKESNEIIKVKPDAVLMVPMFRKESEAIINSFIENDIIVSIINNDIPNHKIFNFVGQDLIKSGRIAAKLFDTILDHGKIAILYIGTNFENATYFQEKEKGFKEFIKQSDTKLESTTLTYSSEELEQRIISFLNENINVKGIFVTNSKVSKIAKIFNNHNIKNIKLIGYDLLEKNVNYLKNNTVQFLIHQNAKHQTFLGLSNLIEHFIFSKEIPKQNLLPINIINSENIDSYTHKKTVYE